jgi:hypothetical protein
MSPFKDSNRSEQPIRRGFRLALIILIITGILIIGLIVAWIRLGG